ncbi:MAG: carbohydrate-binding domain-containing protein [Clostridia bacterium]|nr:carbohydrate-binding domain-containing protein [Clostridia bacterium]
MRKFKILFAVSAVILSAVLMLSACTQNSILNGESGSAGKTDSSLSLDASDMFTTRDVETDYDESAAQKITLSEDNPKISITAEGVYVISGSASDGSITVDAPDDAKVQIVLSGVSLTSKTSAALYVKSADKVFVTLQKGTENTLANGGAFTADGSEKIDGAIYSKSDITFNGEGTLNITSPAAHGIVGKDDVKFTGGAYKINCASHGVDANDSIRVLSAAFTITAGKDGLHCDNDEDAEKGYIYIESGTFSIDVDDDGIHAVTTLQINGGTLNIKAAEGLEATCVLINDGTVSIEASDDGINAAKKSSAMTPTVEINGGKITIVMGKGDTDGIDSNGNIIINGGTVDITGNSSFDYDGKGELNGGTVIVNGSEVTTLPNQFMGGAGGMGGGPGGMPGGLRGNFSGETPNSDAITSATPNADTNGNMPQIPDENETGENTTGRKRPDFGNQDGFSGKRFPGQSGDGETLPERPGKSA